MTPAPSTLIMAQMLRAPGISQSRVVLHKHGFERRERDVIALLDPEQTQPVVDSVGVNLLDCAPTHRSDTADERTALNDLAIHAAIVGPTVSYSQISEIASAAPPSTTPSPTSTASLRAIVGAWRIARACARMIALPCPYETAAGSSLSGFGAASKSRLSSVALRYRKRERSGVQMPVRRWTWTAGLRHVEKPLYCFAAEWSLRSRSIRLALDTA